MFFFHVHYLFIVTLNIAIIIVRLHFMASSVCCYLAVVGELVCLYDPSSYTGGASSPWQVGGWACGQQPHPRKQMRITETVTVLPTETWGPVRNSSQTTGTMTTADESPSQEVRSPNQAFLGPQTTIRLDHIIVNKKWQRSLFDVKVHRGADFGSDHHLLISKTRLKLRATPTIKQRRRVFDVNKTSCTRG